MNLFNIYSLPLQKHRMGSSPKMTTLPRPPKNGLKVIVRLTIQSRHQEQWIQGCHSLIPNPKSEKLKSKILATLGFELGSPLLCIFCEETERLKMLTPLRILWPNTL